jgi:cobalamin biosynthesis protein CobT
MLAQACEWSNVPFECVCFNTGSSDTPGYWGSCPTTIEIKNFNQTFEESKPFFAINNSRLIRSLDKINNVPSFTGNIDEVNLYYIANRLEKVDHETKLMFVLSDGQTCGSEGTLKQVVSRIENEQNIIVIGIGICSNDVPNIYSKYKVFRNIQELEGLGAYLIDTLGQYAA